MASGILAWFHDIQDGLWHLLGFVAFMRRFCGLRFPTSKKASLSVLIQKATLDPFGDKIFHMLQLHVGSVRVLHDILPDSARYRNSVAESSLSFMSLLLWEAQRVIGVVDVEAGKLNCDRVSRFYRPPASGRRIKLFIHVFMGGLNCNRGR